MEKENAKNEAHISIGVSCLLGLMAVAAAVAILFVINKSEVSETEPALSYEQLVISVDFPAGEQQIHIWEAQEGIFYFFLPSGAENCEVKFSNLGAESTLRLGSRILTSEDCTINSLVYSQEYELELNASQEQAALEPVQVIFMKSSEISSLYIDTASGNMDAVHADKEVKEKASVCLLGADGSMEYSGALQYIKSRGNATFNVEKKSYQIRFSKDVSLLGMPSAEKWILLANAYDGSLIKNAMVFDFAERYTSVPSIQGRFVDLYLNGDYVGNYYLCEKVEVGKNRLNITNLEKETEQVNFQRDYDNASLYVSMDGRIKATSGLDNPEDITGGYLLEHIPEDEYETAQNAFMTNQGQCFAIIHPDPATVEQARYICNLFNEMETAMSQEDGIHPETGKHFSEYLDVDSWTSKYLIEEAFHDVDAWSRSMFFYKDADNVDTHIFSGPMWDYDGALGGYMPEAYWFFSPSQIGDFGIYVSEMMQHQEVREQVFDKFKQYMLPYVKYLAGAEVYELSREIWDSTEMNSIRWPDRKQYYSDIVAERDYLVYFLEQKTEHLQKVWLEEEDYCTVTFLDYYGNAYAVYSVKRGECLENAPVIQTYIAIFNGWYRVDTGIRFDSTLPVLQDVVYEPGWISVDSLLLNGLTVSGMDVSEVDTESLQSIIDRIRELQREAANAEAEGSL